MMTAGLALLVILAAAVTFVGVELLKTMLEVQNSKLDRIEWKLDQMNRKAGKE